MNDPRPPHERGTSGEVFVFFILPMFVCIGVPMLIVLDWLSK